MQLFLSIVDTLVGVSTLVLTFLEGRRVMRRSAQDETNPGAARPSPWREHWPLTAMVAILVLFFGFRIYQGFSQPDWLAIENDLATVLNQDFKNQEIEIDGKRFRGCSFENVTLVFNGRWPFEIALNRFIGAGNAIEVRGNTPAIGGVSLMYLQKDFGLPLKLPVGVMQRTPIAPTGTASTPSRP